jgi:DNA invertase Pin-like site-specific DNA recombinase
MTRVIESIQIQRSARTRKLSKGQRVGYLRVSSLDQNEVRQLEGLALDKAFTDKASGKDAKRPQLEAMQSFVREGDTVFCQSMDRLARNLDDLRRIVLRLTDRGIHIVFVKEDLTFTGEDSPMSNLLLSVMGAFAQFERELIRERQREGIAIAKREGKYKGRKPSLTPARVAELRRRVTDGDSKAALAREFGISRDTLYRYVPVKKHRAGKLAK